MALPGSIQPSWALPGFVVDILLSHTLKSCRIEVGGGGGIPDVSIGRGVLQAHCDWLAESEQGIPQGSLCLCLRLKTQTVQSGLAASGSPEFTAWSAVLQQKATLQLLFSRP